MAMRRGEGFKAPFAVVRHIGTSMEDQLVSGFARAIRSGAYADGTVLPGVRKLAGMFGVSEITIRNAVKRLCRDTGLGAKVYADKIPFEGGSFALGKQLDIDPVSAAMNGGDDYQLMYVVPIAQYERFRKDFQTFDIIGHLARKDVGSVLVSPDGLEHPLRAQGWK